MSCPAPHLFEGPALAEAIPDLSLPAFIRARARSFADEIALYDLSTRQQITYRTLDQWIGRCAAGWAALGMKPGDVVVMLAPNILEWPIAALGAMAVGGVVSGVNPGYTVDDLVRQMRDAQARFVFTVPSLLGAVREAEVLLGGFKIVVLGEAAGCIDFAVLMTRGDDEPPIVVEPEAMAALPYSSGTTGLPKGVMLSHRALVANACQYTQVWPTPPGSVLLAFLPMFHITGFTIVTLCGLATGAKVVMLPSFETQSFLQAMADHRVTHLNTVPPIMQLLAFHPLVDAYDLSALQMVGCGAAPLGSQLEQKVAKRLKCQVGQGFGMTESSGCITVTPPHQIRPGSSGCPLPGTQIRVLDTQSAASAEPGTAGELWFRGPQAFSGYWKQPEATREGLSSDGWVRTGDVGFFDSEGYLYITDRLKELIKVKGFQVAPAELEALLVVHPAVLDAAVIGRPDERSGELPVAYVVTKGAQDIAQLPQQILAWMETRVPTHKRLGEVVLCEAIPKTAAGKILRQSLRARDAQRVMAIRAAEANSSPAL